MYGQGVVHRRNYKTEVKQYSVYSELNPKIIKQLNNTTTKIKSLDKVPTLAYRFALYYLHATWLKVYNLYSQTAKTVVHIL